MYKLNNEILKEEKVRSVIKNVIKMQTELNRDIISARLRWDLLKTALVGTARKFSKERAKRMRLRKETLLKELELAEKIFLENQNQQSLVELNKLQSQVKEFLENQSKGAILRTRAKWIAHGEKSSRCFFSLEKSRAMKKTIFQLHQEDTVIREHGAIQHTIYEYFRKMNTSSQLCSDEYRKECQDLLGSLNLRHLTEQEKDSLNSNVSEEELK